MLSGTVRALIVEERPFLGSATGERTRHNTGHDGVEEDVERFVMETDIWVPSGPT